MFAQTHSVAFEGIDVLRITTEVQISNGLPAFNIVGLADKAVAESKERIRSALHAIGLALPASRITVNLAPADVVKEGTHYDLPIALGIIAAMGVIAPEQIKNTIVMGELGLDGSVRSVAGILPAAMAARAADMTFVCPDVQSNEALWSGLSDILATPHLQNLINHFKGVQSLPFPVRNEVPVTPHFLDFRDIKGQETAKRALEICAVGGHNMLMIGPPGSGKSMLAARLPSIMPDMTNEEILEVSQIHSVAGLLKDGHLITTRPFRDPHHSASVPAMVGGGAHVRPGEVSLAHRGILFLDELPEFNRVTLEALRQPLETGRISVARVQQHVTYPARFQLICAMNPCRCGYLGVKGQQCSRAPKCAMEYQGKISGPLYDRIDLHVEVPAVAPWQLGQLQNGESSAEIKERVLRAISFSRPRFEKLPISKNAEADGTVLEEMVCLTDTARKLLVDACEKMHLTARGYHRMMRVARTIADMAFHEEVQKEHVAEALSFRKLMLGDNR